MFHLPSPLPMSHFLSLTLSLTLSLLHVLSLSHFITIMYKVMRVKPNTRIPQLNFVKKEKDDSAIDLKSSYTTSQ